MVFLYITCPTLEEAKKISHELIRQKVAGCVNIAPIQSIYRDNEGAKEVSEFSLFVKTIDSKVQEVEDVARGIHSYKVPCIATFSLHRLNREYKEWLATAMA
ncbi:MAG: hypothetical protein A3A43_03045 [Candidatus Liptonbacteria bacterium RIFCSPLOWO2_01_FULL_56_20]|uniref:Cation tolerance protein CutA n=1 Tax=Candidatus Liptonbacteria bacterium RIFCSPLOWO2_01_FULL_56_20 TaxID=1798652 RepID=A0A1G2CJX1_9BACT|nr:MAG: hypothetical protein A2681_00175 [Candidatus Liptonbacteria bacterium RIFCSPHIGHO2_01_FULL_56_18b]OGZ01020.1 MAG: hypothetical protein A3A43_03045 [Candidatus Liptonbacteria bacterium RIFCSPLOWO2_01_FULL_56_20]